MHHLRRTRRRIALRMPVACGRNSACCARQRRMSRWWSICSSCSLRSERTTPGFFARFATSSVGMQWFDRLLGGVFGLLRGALVVMVLVMAMASFLPSSNTLANSSLAQYFLVAGRAAVYAGPGELKRKFRDGLKALERARGNSS